MDTGVGDGTVGGNEAEGVVDGLTQSDEAGKDSSQQSPPSGLEDKTDPKGVDETDPEVVEASPGEGQKEASASNPVERE